MWHKSSIKEKLKALFLRLNNNQKLYIYKDPAYGSAYKVVSAYRRTSTLPLTREQKQLNKWIAKVQISVEQIFGHIVIL